MVPDDWKFWLHDDGNVEIALWKDGEKVLVWYVSKDDFEALKTAIIAVT